MKQPKCNVCNHQFGWKKTYNSIMRSRKIHCDDCGTELEATNLGRLTLLVITAMALTGWVLDDIVFMDNSDNSFIISLLIKLLLAFFNLVAFTLFNKLQFR